MTDVSLYDARAAGNRKRFYGKGNLSPDRDFNSFYETTASNIGQSLKFFTDVEAARAWLKSQIQKSHHPI